MDEILEEDGEEDEEKENLPPQVAAEALERSAEEPSTLSMRPRVPRSHVAGHWACNVPTSVPAACKTTEESVSKASGAVESTEGGGHSHSRQGRCNGCA